VLPSEAKILQVVLLNSEGVFKALHALFQVLDLPLLLGQEQVFDAVQARVNPVKSSIDPLVGPENPLQPSTGR